ncbi:MAG TPA: pyridoxal phosphate-dependent aminotransferase [Acidimicrobiia bacterium]|nr:pyridoxal phosphate-dependent aminotransferase [Acidimicrobiia bacterium]
MTNIGSHAPNPHLVEHLRPFGTTIFAEMSALAVETGAINLGQGFPDTDGPDVVKQAAIAAISDGRGNQYPPGIGIAELRHAIVGHQRRFYGLEYDPDHEVLVTAGATEAIAAALLSLCGPGDEVVTFEPYYDSYAACIAMAGAQRRVVTLHPPRYDFDPGVLRDAITARTKLLLLNSPHNPTGKVFSRAELGVIAQLAVEHDLLVVTDEVYEHLVFDGEHVPLASLPGMRERVVTISSAGKTFSFTGWKVGWVCATPELVTAVKTAKQFLTYVSSGPFQYAIAEGLGLPDDFYRDIATNLRERRDRLCAGLLDAGFDVFTPQGTYFITVDIRSLGETDGLAFCRRLPHRCGVVAIPSVVFYDDLAEGAPLVRFACCKRLEVLDEAVTRLKALRS